MGDERALGMEPSGIGGRGKGEEGRRREGEKRKEKEVETGREKERNQTTPTRRVGNNGKLVFHQRLMCCMCF